MNGAPSIVSASCRILTCRFGNRRFRWNDQPLIFIPESCATERPFRRRPAQLCFYWIILNVADCLPLLPFITHERIPVFALPERLERRTPIRRVPLCPNVLPASCRKIHLPNQSDLPARRMAAPCRASSSPPTRLLSVFIAEIVWNYWTPLPPNIPTAGSTPSLPTRLISCPTAASSRIAGPAKW